MRGSWDYNTYKHIMKDEDLPAMVVDMEQLDRNIDLISAKSNKYGKQLRLASKSIRVPALIKYILEKGGSNYLGIMCFSVREAEYLASLGIENLLIAYPTVRDQDIKIFF